MLLWNLPCKIKAETLSSSSWSNIRETVMNPKELISSCFSCSKKKCNIFAIEVFMATWKTRYLLFELATKFWKKQILCFAILKNLQFLEILRVATKICMANENGKIFAILELQLAMVQPLQHGSSPSQVQLATAVCYWLYCNMASLHLHCIVSWQNLQHIRFAFFVPNFLKL